MQREVMRREVTRRPLVVVAALLVGITLGGCASSTPGAEDPQVTGLTTEQAERLAVARFRNFDAGVREVTVTVAGDDTGEIVVAGWYDYATHTGYGSATAAGADAGLIWWSADTIATREGATGEEIAPLPLPDDGWQSGALDPSSTNLANSLALVTNLGSDRPENPQLLAQSDAAFLKKDTIDGTAVEVFIGPSAEGTAESTAAADLTTRARYWVDSTGTLLKFESPLGDGSTGATATIELGTTSDVDLPTTVPGT